MAPAAPPGGVSAVQPAPAGSDTRRLRRRSVVGGIVVPLLLIVLDPGIILWASPWTVLPDPALGPAWLRGAEVLVLTCIALAGGLLYLIEAKPMRAPWLAACGGALACASALPTVVCVRTVPMGVLLLIVGIGALGFLPVWTAYEWAQSAMRALDRSTRGQRAHAALAYALCGALGLASICVAAQYLSWRWSLRHDLTALLDAGSPRVDLAREITFEWDRVAFLGGFVTKQNVRELLGFAWTSNELRQLGFWRDNTLVVFLNGQEVAASVLFEDREFRYCSVPVVVPRSEAMMEVRDRTMCRLDTLP